MSQDADVERLALWLVIALTAWFALWNVFAPAWWRLCVSTWLGVVCVDKLRRMA